MVKILNQEIEKYAKAHSHKESELLSELRAQTRTNFTWYQMLSGPLVTGLLSFLIKISVTRKILEIGTFSGYSALAMAEALPEEGSLVTLELDEKHKKFAQSYFDRSPHGSKIEILLGDARESLNHLAGPFDMVFIDADKTSYPEYYAKSLSLLNTGGFMVLDNCLWDGTVLDPVEESAMAIDSLNKTIRSDNRVENIILTIRDGLHIVRKL